MNNRTLFSIVLLLASSAVLIPAGVNSQTTVTLTSLQTVTTEVTQTSVSYSTMAYTATWGTYVFTGSNVSLNLLPSAPGSCHFANLPFLATKGQQIFVHLGTTAPIDFFLLTEGDFQTWLKGGSCAVSNAILSQYDIHEFNQASEPITISATGAYEFLFLNTASNPAPVSFNSDVTITSLVLVQQASTMSVLVTSTQSPTSTQISVGNPLTSIPGFPLESLLVGLLLGFAILVLLNRSRRIKHN